MAAYRNAHTYQVISWSALDGIRVDHFLTEEEARQFASIVADEGFACTVCRVIEVFSCNQRLGMAGGVA